MGAGLRTVYLGNDAWAVPPLEALTDSSHTPVRVVTRVPRPAPRGSGTLPTPVAQAARRLALPVLEVETVKSGPGFEVLREARPDVLVVVAYGEILPPEVLRVPRRQTGRGGGAAPRRHARSARGRNPTAHPPGRGPSLVRPQARSRGPVDRLGRGCAGGGATGSGLRPRPRCVHVVPWPAAEGPCGHGPRRVR